VRKNTLEKRKLRKPVGPENPDSTQDGPIDRLTILLRAFVERKRRKRRSRPKKLMPSDWTLIFDTETTTDQSQNLRFGSYQLRRRGHLRERGVFYNPDALSAENIETIKTVIATERDQYPGERIYVMTRTEFVENVLLDKAYPLGAIIVGFNLPFDLSRLAIGHSSARGRMKGGFSFQLSKRIDRPHLRIKHLNGRSAFIDFSGTKTEALQDNDDDESRVIERGYFVDVKTLLATFTGESHSLGSLSEALKIETPKLDSGEHGRELTAEYVRYGIRDSQTTWECFEWFARRYASYKLEEVGLHELYSGASLGKAYLRAMNVRPWREVQSNFPGAIVGHIMSAYYGGRSEIHLRRNIAEVFYCDFLSMYPTVCTLMGLWRFVIARGIDWKDDTANVRKLVESLKPADLQRPETWRRFAVLVKVLPDDDVFPIRARYPVDAAHVDGDTATIGLNRLTRKEPLWFTLADCLVSKILTGKSPRIVEAIRFEPREIQDNLKSISIAGNDAYRIDPTIDDFYKRLIELRQVVKRRKDDASSDESLALGSDETAIKLLANATSYGIFVELNVEDLDKPERMICYGWQDRPWPTISKKYERPGQYFHPLVGTLITGAARLMLALAERRALDEGLDWAFCDTDSLAIAKPDKLARDSFIKRALAVCDWFKPLNPYGEGGSAKGSILQIEGVNFRPGCEDDLAALEPLHCLAVSAKRYALFNKGADDKLIVRKASGHGLGHLLAPYEDPEQRERIKRIGVELWEEDLWREIIRSTIEGHPDQVSLDHLAGFELPGCSRYAANNPALFSWFREYNSTHPYAEGVHPFNFLLSLQAKSIVQLAAEDPFTAAGRRSTRRQHCHGAMSTVEVCAYSKSAVWRRSKKRWRLSTLPDWSPAARGCRAQRQDCCSKKLTNATALFRNPLRRGPSAA
jgi:hypothetical protein